MSSRWTVLILLALTALLRGQSINWSQIRNPHLISGSLGGQPACNSGTAGWIYIALNASAGQQTLACAGGVWTVQGGGGSGTIVGPGTTVSGFVPQWGNTTGTLLTAGLAVSASPAPNTIVESNGSGVLAGGWFPTSIPSTSAGITGFTTLGTGTQLGVNCAGSFTSGHLVTYGASGCLQDGGNPVGSGTVTSVALTGIASLITVGGSPITSAGTLSLALTTQSANLGFYGPTTGSAAAPTFRAQVVADLPTTHLGSLFYGGAAGAPTELPGNTTSTQQLLCQTGTGSVSAAPAWCTVSTGVTSVVNDANVTGSIAGAVLTLNWTSSLSTARGGLGSSITSPAAGTYPKSNGSVFGISSLAAAGIGSCTNQAVTALNGDAAPSCSTITSSFVNNSIATTGGDITTSVPSQVQGLNGAIAPISAFFLGTNGSRQLVGLTATTATAALNIFTSSLAGLVPASGGGTTNFMRADGAWAAPPGGGSGGGGGVAGWSGIPLSFVTTSTQYSPPVGGGMTSTTESVVQNASPAAATLSNLQVTLSGALGTSATLGVTLRVGTVSSLLSCTTAPGGTTCSSTASVTVSAGINLDFQLVPSGTVTSGLPSIIISYAVGTSGVGVTSVSTSAPITGGPFTSSGTIGCPTCTVTIASGTISLGTATINSGTCATSAVTASGVLNTDSIIWSPNASLRSTTGYIAGTSGGLSIALFPSSNSVNWENCNWSGSSITPGAVTLNYRVVR